MKIVIIHPPSTGIKGHFCEDSYESLPTSSVAGLPSRIVTSFGLMLLFEVDLCGLRLSGVDESAFLRLLSSGEETEEVLRLRLPAGAYLSIDRRLF